tara:strand:- start:3531 stop:4439 length:909 start_codon:yes stop_codon:yes gene_type:complete
MLSELLVYGKRDKTVETALITVIALILSLIFLYFNKDIFDIPEIKSLSTSNYMSNELLAIFRSICAVLSIFTLSWIVLDPKGAPDYPLYYDERKNRRRNSSGLTRLAPFTMWHFGLFGLNFIILASISWINISGNEVPNWILISAPILFATTYSCAILVTCIVTFHMIDNELSKGNNIDHLFYWYEIIMHNFNVIILGVALVINNIELNWKYFVFPIIFGILYVGWARIYAYYAGVYIYNFLDPRLNGGPVLHFMLLGIIFISFTIVIILKIIINWNILIAILIVSLFTFSIIRIRKPETNY